MAQRVFWNYQDDDLTVDLNAWLRGINDPGLYRGFDFTPTADLQLTLVHSVSGVDIVKPDLSRTAKYGVIITQQSALVTETETVELPVAAGDATNPRIDVVVCQHSYVYAAGGNPAVYLVKAGTPSATPVAPAIDNTSTDTILGYLYVPANATMLTDAGVVYTKAEVPAYAGSELAYKNRLNVFTKQNTFAPEAPGSFNTGTKTFTLTEDSNIFVLPNTVSTANYLQYIPIKPAGTEVQLRVNSASMLVKHGTGTNAISNSVEGVDAEYTLGVILYLRSNGTYWDMYDVSSKSVYRDHGLYQNSSQRKFSTNGVKIKSNVYTVGPTTYTLWILEINPLADNFVLDLTDPALLGGFDPTSNLLSVGTIDVLPGLKDSGNGFTAKIYIKSNASTTLLAVHSPSVVTNPALRTMGNVSELLDSRSGTAFGLDALELHKAHATYPTVSELEITLTPDNKFLFKPITRMNQLNGGTDYAANVLGAVSGDTHREAIDKIIAKIAPATYHSASPTYTLGTNVTSLTFPVVDMVRSGLIYGITCSGLMTLSGTPQKLGNVARFNLAADFGVSPLMNSADQVIGSGIAMIDGAEVGLIRLITTPSRPGFVVMQVDFTVTPAASAVFNYVVHGNIVSNN